MSSGPHRQKRAPFSLDELRAQTANHPRSGEAMVKKSDDERIYEYAIAGYTPPQIAVLVQKPQEDVEASLFAAAERSRQRWLAEMAVEDIIDLDRISFMLNAIWPACQQGQLVAIDRARELIKDRRKILKLGEVDLSKGVGGDVDLSVLSLEELEMLERIQKKLAAPKARPPASPQSDQPILDAEVEVVTDSKALPEPSPQAKPRRRRKAPSEAVPVSSPAASEDPE